LQGAGHIVAASRGAGSTLDYVQLHLCSFIYFVHFMTLYTVQQVAIDSLIITNTLLLLLLLASCGAVYCDLHNTLRVCNGRAGRRCPNLTTASVRLCLRLSEHFFHYYYYYYY